MHASALVILPQHPTSDEHRDAMITVILDPFDEDKPTACYPVGPCWCIGYEVSRIAERGELGVESMGNMKARFDAANRGQWGHWPNYLPVWQDQYLNPWRQAIADAIEADPRKSNAAPECEYCNGSGVSPQRHRPGNYDWYEIGGRWRTEVFKDAADEGPLINLAPGWFVNGMYLPHGTYEDEDRYIHHQTIRRHDWRMQLAEIASAHHNHYGVLIDRHH